MKLGEALSVLSKSSPFSVATQTDRPKDEFDHLKDYLYIEQEIESKFRSLLDSSRSNQILFLCGSSGDGKSEILTRAYRDFRDKIAFHLDATHGFEPHQTAVQALDLVFDRHRTSESPLAVGINVGMMSNYAAEGAERHDDIKVAIREFVAEGKTDDTGDCIFLDFESFPKFQFSEEQLWSAPFSSALMNRLTQQTPDNPFRSLLNQEPETEADRRIAENFRFFAQPAVQKYINKLLFRARLEFDQFMTARALLDFIFQIITGPGALVDNLFSGSDNDLAHKVAEFDPAEQHSKGLDLFWVSSDLQQLGPEIQDFVTDAQQYGLYSDSGVPVSPTTLLRLFAVCREVDIGNNFHHQFQDEFSIEDRVFERYARIWFLHSEAEQFDLNKGEVIRFYVNEFIPAIHAYANRRSPWLSEEQFYLQELNHVVVSANFALDPPSRLCTADRPKATSFTATVCVAGQSQSLQVSLPLFRLLNRIRGGYRPTRYDRNTTVMLDDFISRLSRHAKTTSKLLFSGPSVDTLEVRRLAEDFYKMEFR